jgi:hypothetical protein
LGDGFILEEIEAQRLLQSSERAQDVVKRLVNGKEFSSMPEFRPVRWVLDFGEMDEAQARKYEEPFSIVERLVKPERAGDNRPARRDRFWRFGEIAKGLYSKLAECERGIARLFTCEYWFWDFFTPGPVVTNGLVVVADERASRFTMLSSGIHEVWAGLEASSLVTRFRYTPSRCFTTFPFPAEEFSLENIGQIYWQERREIMAMRQEGLTGIYEHLHDRGEKSEDIAKLRKLRVEMDQAVAAAYGWSDLDLGHGFHKTKQGERYTLGESARREVLDRLLALNHQRHVEELAAELNEKKVKKTTSGKPATKRETKAKVSAPETGVPVMPADFRFPAPSPQLYAVNLVTALLSTHPDGLSWPVLRDAFSAVTTPDLMRRLALPEDKDRVAAWASRWNERASPGLLIPTLRDMTSANIAVDGRGTRAIFSLQDGPQEAATEDVGYDAWLALRVTEPLSTPILPDDEAATLDTEIEAFFATL